MALNTFSLVFILILIIEMKIYDIIQEEIKNLKVQIKHLLKQALYPLWKKQKQDKKKPNEI